MKIKIDNEIKDFDGKAIKEMKGEGKEAHEKIVTFREIIGNALNLQSNEHILTAEKKVYAFQIGIKLFSKQLNEYDLTSDQVAFLKERIGLFFGPVVYGRFLELIGDEIAKQ